MLNAAKILNSREEQTIQVNWNGFIGSAPEGKSKGSFEAKPYLTNIDDEISKLREINLPEINSFEDFRTVERLSKDLGSVARIALEFAIIQSKTYKLFDGRKLPRPLGNVIGGGLHRENSTLEFQEFLVIDSKSRSFVKAAENNMNFYNFIGEKLGAKLDNFDGGRTDEGAWSPYMNNEDVLDLLSKYSKKFGLRIGIDMAASSFFRNNLYTYKDKELTKDEQIDYVNSLIKKYDLYYVEDPLHENDFLGFSHINKRALVVGDDLTVTNMTRLKQALQLSSVNAFIVKPNQCGSLVEVREIADYAKGLGVVPIISHRSGETMDTSISHLAVGLEIPIIKCGIFGKEREVKIKELINIEKEISSK
ncbi:hypothetical protein J4425_01145 [Candidatus Woesearchaeota archaeon]|nr:hypothetical protein [Candidatus Woesearchaeota archaeon]